MNYTVTGWKWFLWIRFLTRFKDALGNGKIDYPETNREVTPLNDVPNLTLHENEYRLQMLFKMQFPTSSSCGFTSDDSYTSLLVFLPFPAKLRGEEGCISPWNQFAVRPKFWSWNRMISHLFLHIYPINIQLYLKYNTWRDNIAIPVKTSRWRDAIIDDTFLNLNRGQPSEIK